MSTWKTCNRCGRRYISPCIKPKCRKIHFCPQCFELETRLDAEAARRERKHKRNPS